MKSGHKNKVHINALRMQTLKIIYLYPALLAMSTWVVVIHLLPNNKALWRKFWLLLPRYWEHNYHMIQSILTLHDNSLHAGPGLLSEFGQLLLVLSLFIHEASHVGIGGLHHTIESSSISFIAVPTLKPGDQNLGCFWERFISWNDKWTKVAIEKEFSDNTTEVLIWGSETFKLAGTLEWSAR